MSSNNKSKNKIKNKSKNKNKKIPQPPPTNYKNINKQIKTHIDYNNKKNIKNKKIKDIYIKLGIPYDRHKLSYKKLFENILFESGEKLKSIYLKWNKYFNDRL